jgi:hypothetical protein
MANIIRSAKSARVWTSSELRAYKITTRMQDAATFFEAAILPQPGVDDEILTVDVHLLWFPTSENFIPENDGKQTIAINLAKYLGRCLYQSPTRHCVRGVVESDLQVNLFENVGDVAPLIIARLNGTTQLTC